MRSSPPAVPQRRSRRQASHAPRWGRRCGGGKAGAPCTKVGKALWRREGRRPVHQGWACVVAERRQASHP
eukprot:360970-Chlamydomonas_euryale.AAC.2